MSFNNTIKILGSAIFQATQGDLSTPRSARGVDFS